MSLLNIPLSQDPIPETITLPSVENPDWGSARTCRSVLMTPSADWVQSVYSCQVDLNGKRLVAPNRDYPYEGLMVYQDSENWKTIDCVMLGLLHRGQFVPLEPLPGEQAVQINPWRVTYRYRVAGDAGLGSVPICLSYYLNSENSPDWVTGCFELSCLGLPVADPENWSFYLEPFLDIRHMWKSSDFHLYNHWIDSDPDGSQRIHISVHNRVVAFYLADVEASLFTSGEYLGWHYKLGTGERAERYDEINHRSQTLFKAEDKSLGAFFDLRIPLTAQPQCARVFFGVGLKGESFYHGRAEIEAVFDRSRQADLNRYHQLQRQFPLPAGLAVREAVWGRIAGLTKFKTYIQVRETGERIMAPHAGAMWFKTPWYRDVFEGILNSFQTLMALEDEREHIRQVILLALGEQEPGTGRILNRIPELKGDAVSYNTSDGALLCFMAAFAYAAATRDLTFAQLALESFSNLYRYFNRQPELVRPYFNPDDAPRLDPQTGLLLSVPQHAWIDTRNQVYEAEGQVFKDLTNRVSRRFIQDIYDCLTAKDRLGEYFASPNFYLPEINAQWILTLRSLIETVDLVLADGQIGPDQRDELQGLKDHAAGTIELAESHYKALFWNPANHFLFNLVDATRDIQDAVETEPGVVAAALLGQSVFSPGELRAIWDCARKRLLLYRRLQRYGSQLLPFGVIAKNEGQNVFYGDGQYHADVVWLRSLPYIIKLLQSLNEPDTIGAILINALDHQMTEGAVFYSQELLARPLGNNPNPVEATAHNPVPVKNPIQFWSQWCDAMVNYYAGGKHDD